MSQTDFYYSFTITLKPKIYKYEPYEQYDLATDNIHKILRTLCEKITLVAECTKSYNIHYHGMCTFNKYKNFPLKEWFSAFRNDLYVGFTKIEQTLNEERWTQYIKKDIYHTTNSINRRSIILDDINIFNMDELANCGITW